MRVLLVDDEPSVRVLHDLLRGHAHVTVRSVATVAAGGLADDVALDLVVLGPAAASAAPDLAGTAPVVVVGSRDCAADAVAALRAGAADYVTLDTPDLASRLTALARSTRPAPAGEPEIEGLVGSSAAIHRVRTLVRTAAATGAPVLIEGETGTGKEVVARAIHKLGARAHGPFIPVNCAAVPETLAESEFFGHARGAFTGAMEARAGALRLADGGTLFLDEIEDLPLSLQAKLLRVVQDGEVRPLGASSARRVDARLVAASNRELWNMVESGAFRRDLFYRLRVLTIQLPPLRERGADLPLLVTHFVAAFNRRHGTRFAVPAASQMRPLLDHPWPGNVRELENTLESLLILAGAEGRDLATVLRSAPSLSGGFWPDERARILRVLNDHRWNRQRAAAALGISRVTLWRRMERHGIRDPFGADTRATS